MKFIQVGIKQIQEKFSNQFLRNLSWLGMAEIIYRVVRIGCVAITARYLSEYDYGLGALVLTVKEFAISFSNVGIGAKIIQAEKEKLPGLCDSAYWLNWLVFGGLFIIQCLVAFPISWIRQTPELVLPLCVAGIAYLIWPLAGIQKTLIQRENRFKIIAFTDSIQFSIASFLTAIFAIAGMRVWAFALPSLIIAPLEVIIYRYFHDWRPNREIVTKYWGEIWHFGKNILAIGLLNTLRNSLDYLIIFPLLGPEALGLYYFGFNAGLGISLSIINAIKSAILPHLCAARSDTPTFEKTYLHTIKIIALIIIPFVIFQASMAPFYVPIVFGQKWIPAIPIVILICLSAIPRPFADAASQLLVAVGRPDLDLRWNFIFTILFAIAVLVGVTMNILGVAVAVLVVHCLCLPLFSLWATKLVFSKLGKIDRI